ncbi:hypothetical protein ABID59_000408 [Bradyrhizobium sp. S3.3.6]|uniref:Uncharacterized protein n=1 Tax=Bradyrhizobium cytisi TaxID=515489 RepID=A0A5S4W410_9BRAD|nr:hypothetical protein [Bradyrhizobium cytisi]TYL73596.1 hypothetical protein FXB38_36090 [Bradyrhizobium cytisi]
MKPQLPGLPTMAALMLAATITVWLGLWGPLDLSRIEKWQTLTVGVFAICGVLFTASVAVRNVTRQIRINILSREEDRIERLLPGLRAAAYFASGFLQYRVAHGFLEIVEAFRGDGFGVEGSTYQKDIQTALPAADAATQLRVEQRLYSCFNWGRHAENAAHVVRAWTAETSNHAEWDPSALESRLAEIEEQRNRFATARTQFGLAMDELEAEIIAIRAQIDLYQARSVRIRREIEAYFGGAAQRS